MYEAEKREIKDEVRKHLKKKKWEMDYWCRFTTSSASLARDVVDQWTLWQLQLDQVSRVLFFSPENSFLSHTWSSSQLTYQSFPPLKLSEQTRTSTAMCV